MRICVHCKTIDIKNLTQNIVWISPEGGGPNNTLGVIPTRARCASEHPIELTRTKPCHA